MWEKVIKTFLAAIAMEVAKELTDPTKRDVKNKERRE